METLKKGLTRKQHELIADVLDGQDLDYAMAYNNITPSRFYDWLESKVFMDTMGKVLRIRQLRAHLIVASASNEAATRLVALTKNDKLDIGRKACLDILTGAYLQKEPGIIVHTSGEFRNGVLRAASEPNAETAK